MSYLKHSSSRFPLLLSTRLWIVFLLVLLGSGAVAVPEGSEEAKEDVAVSVPNRGNFSAARLSSGAHELLAPLRPTTEQGKTAQDIVRKLAERHYRDMPFDDELSSRFLDAYLKTLDPAKSFFFKTDVEEFEKHRQRLDDYFKSGRLDPGFDIYNRYRDRVMLRLEAIITELENEDREFDFTHDEDLSLDIETAEWAQDQATANQLWHQRLKSNVLDLMLAEKTEAEAKDVLIKRYNNQLHRLSQQNNVDVFELMMNTLATLYDPHTGYLSPRTLENFNINMSLSLEGIGAVLRTEDEYTTVESIVPAGPADLQGALQPTHRIVSVGQGEDGELVDVIGWRLEDVVNLIRGPRNTVVRLQVLKQDNMREMIQITRNTVKLEEAAAKKATFELTDGNELYKIGVINVPTFYLDFEAYRQRDPNYKSTTRDVRILLEELQDENVDGVILDLRDNGGGSLQEATMLTDLFIDPGPVVQIRQSNQTISRNSRSRSMAEYRGPLVVLVNRLSASASEIFAGAIQDYQRGLIVGSRTFGKGTVQSLTPVYEGQVKITESKFYRVSGDSTQHRGVIPDVSYPDLIDIEQIGESAYDNALPWDQIHAVPHARYFDLEEKLPFLQEEHDQRAVKDPDFVYLIDQFNAVQKASKRQSVSLNEEARRAQRRAQELKALELENKRRLAKGLKPYEDLEAFHAAETDDDESPTVRTRNREINPLKDPILNETGYVLLDYIKLLEADRVQRVANF